MQRLKDVDFFSKFLNVFPEKSRIRVLGFIAGTLRPTQKQLEPFCSFHARTTSNSQITRIFSSLSSYYWRFVENSALFATPLHKLAKSPCCARPKKRNGVSSLKNGDQRILVNFDASKLADIHINASGISVEDVFYQRDLQFREGILAYGSRRLTLAKQHYAAAEREWFALIWTCKNYRFYVLGWEDTA